MQNETKQLIKSAFIERRLDSDNPSYERLVLGNYMSAHERALKCLEEALGSCNWGEAILDISRGKAISGSKPQIIQKSAFASALAEAVRDSFDLIHLRMDKPLIDETKRALAQAGLLQVLADLAKQDSVQFSAN